MFDSESDSGDLVVIFPDDLSDEELVEVPLDKSAHGMVFHSMLVVWNSRFESISVFGSIRWCVWSVRPSSPLRLPHLEMFVMLC